MSTETEHVGCMQTKFVWSVSSENFAKEAGARVVGTGRSDYPNQINNVLIFPGIFRGALDAGAVEITDEMKIAAAYALAYMIDDNDLNEAYIIPEAFHPGVTDAVAKAVAKAWQDRK